MDKKNRMTICFENDMAEVLELVKNISDDKNIIGKFIHALLREKLYYFLDETNCDLKFFDRDVKHLLMRVDSGIYSRQFNQAISINKMKGGNDEK